MPLKKGHIAMLMASGMMGTVKLTDEKGKPMLIKGRVIKVVEKTEQPDAKEADTVVETYKDRFVTTVAVLKQDGIQVIQDVKGLSEFMKVHGEKIAAHVLETYKPIYNLDPTSNEIAALDRLGNTTKSPSRTRACWIAACTKTRGSGVGSFNSKKWRGQLPGGNGDWENDNIDWRDRAAGCLPGSRALSSTPCTQMDPRN
jgi:hypothetical protein